MYFFFKCEICLCWQHGDCVNIKTAAQVPENYLCWVCNEPSNQLKKLKYQNWMNTRLEKELSLNKSKKLNSQTAGESSSSQNLAELNKLRLLNECSKRYYNLNLHMYTLEYQMSMFSQLTSKNTFNRSSNQAEQLDQSIDTEIEYDDETYDQLDKLAQNISHLQTCLTKNFTEFNSKLDGWKFYLINQGY